ncbi:MAG: DUF4304 domain-containing protein [Clostridia bacterium]|nr:DUF4304 domain-containing protein [Clostridia bacterium]
MNTQEFKAFCHELFLKYGFVKVKNMYYLNCHELLCGIYLQRSIAAAYYVELDFFIGDYNDKKSYPSMYFSDMHRRIAVPSKCQGCDGNYFMDACIEYELYTKEEIEPYFVDVLEQYVVPLKTQGKKYIMENQDFYLKAVFKHQIEDVLKKLGQVTIRTDQSGDGSMVE